MTSRRGATSFEPDAGDLIWTDFEPRTGREQGGRRPALVLSPVSFWRASHFVVVCPITSRVRPFAASVVLPEGLDVAGEILVSHVRSIDAAARPIAFTGTRVGDAVIADVRAKLAALVGLDAG
jgi:mRNA interferase MazF